MEGRSRGGEDGAVRASELALGAQSGDGSVAKIGLRDREEVGDFLLRCLVGDKQTRLTPCFEGSGVTSSFDRFCHAKSGVTSRECRAALVMRSSIGI